MKKVIFLLFICILMSGCTVTYNINVDRGKIKEEITSNVDDISSLSDDNYEFMMNDQIAVYFDQKKYYEITHNELDGALTNVYKFTHKIKDYNDAQVLTNCYPKRSIATSGNKIVISIPGPFDCMYSESGPIVTDLVVNVKTDLVVLNHNADEVNDNVYTWHIDSKNYQTKSINIVIDKSGKIMSYIKNLPLGMIIIIVIAFLVVLSIVIYSYAINKQDQTNSF